MYLSQLSEFWGPPQLRWTRVLEQESLESHVIRKAVMRGSEEGRWKSTHRGNSLAAYPTSRSVLREARGAIPRAYSPKPQLVGVNVDPSTAEAIGDWHYWVAQRYSF